MSEGNWSGIGYNPAPGSPEASAELAGKLSRTAKYLDETHQALEDIKGDSDVWKGDASKAFAGKVEELPGYLDNAHLSLSKASKQLTYWQDMLSGYQKRAHTLEDDARAARGKVSQTEAALDKAKANPAFGLANQRFDTDAELREAEQRLAQARAQADAAARGAEQAKISLEEILRQAEKLRDEHDTIADETARKIQAADDGLAPPEPSWWDDVVSWVKDNAGLIGDIAGVVSAVAGALAFIPVLAPVCGPIALAAGAVALAGHGTDMAMNWEDKSGSVGAWAGLGADVLGVIPGIGAISKGMDAASGLVAVDKATAFCAGVGEDMMSAASVPRMAIDSLGYSHVAEAGAKATQSVVNLTTQVPTVTEWATPGETEKAEKRDAGIGAVLGNAMQIK